MSFATFPHLFQPIDDVYNVRYLFSTLDAVGAEDNAQTGQVICELPCTSVTYSNVFNEAGPFSATFNVEDEEVAHTNWITGTMPGKTFFWVLVDDTELVYGGRILNRQYNLQSQTCTISGSDFYSYWSQRIQAADYSAYVGGRNPDINNSPDPSAPDAAYTWYIYPGAPAPFIVWRLFTDAMNGLVQTENVINPLAILNFPSRGLADGGPTDYTFWKSNFPIGNASGPGAGSNPPDYGTLLSSPLMQRSTIDSLVQQLVEVGWLGGVDVYAQPGWGTDPSGKPVPVANQYIYWPRKGISYYPGETPIQTDPPEYYGQPYYEKLEDVPVIDLSTVIDLAWSEDATSQSIAIAEQIGALSAVGPLNVINPPPNQDALNRNYPLTQQACSHVTVSSSALFGPNGTLSGGYLSLLERDDAGLYTYPTQAPTVTIPISTDGTSGFSLGQLQSMLGDDVIVWNPINRFGSNTRPTVPFPPPGFLEVMRIVRVDVTVADAGVSTAVLTLNWPPKLTPTDPPVYESTGPPPIGVGLSATSGATTGGEHVQISGVFLTNVTSVDFGSTPATFTHISSSEVAAVVPPSSSAESVEVTVTNYNGTANIGTFAYYSNCTVRGSATLSGAAT